MDHEDIIERWLARVDNRKIPPLLSNMPIMRNLAENTITAAVLAHHEQAGDERLGTIVTGLMRHLHVFSRVSGSVKGIDGEAVSGARIEV